MIEESDNIYSESTINEIEQSREKEGFKCKQCGLCCKSTQYVNICAEDIERWKKHGRTDLFSNEMKMEWDYFGSSGLFRNSTTCTCPFLGKKQNKKEFYCKIQEIKPLFCRQFPRSKEHAKSFCKCPGYD